MDFPPSPSWSRRSLISSARFCRCKVRRGMKRELHLIFSLDSIQTLQSLVPGGLGCSLTSHPTHHPHTSYTHSCTSAHLKKVHSEWCSKPLSEFGQKLIPGSRRAANYTLISLLDDRRRHGDHILGTMHTKRGFCLGWLNTDMFLGKCELEISASKKKFHIKIIYLKLALKVLKF